MQRIMRDHQKCLHSNKLNNIEVDKFLKTHNLPRLICKEIENLNRYTATNELKTLTIIIIIIIIIIKLLINSRQVYWSGLPFPSPEYLPDPGS